MLDILLTFETMMNTHGLDTVVILAHMNPDGDAAGSVMSLAHYIKLNYPQFTVYPYLADTLDKGPKKLVLTDSVFDPFKKPDVEGKQYAVIACDTATKARMIGEEYYNGAKCSIVIDHHAANEGYGDVNCTLISEACAENIFYILNRELLSKAAKEEVHPTATDYIYLGILHDTGGFTRAKATTMKAASALMDMGVDHSYVMKTLQAETFEDLVKRFRIIKSAKRVMDGKVAYVCIDRQESIEKGIGYEDIHSISNFLRDCEDIEVGFSMYEEAPDIWRCSFRSDGKWIDVNELLIPFGGGGHVSASGLRRKTNNPEQLRQEILDRISVMRSEM